MPDPQPTTAAMRLTNVVDKANGDEWLYSRRLRIALALDDAGVGKAVEFLGWANADMKLNDKAFYDSNYEAAAEESDHAWSNIMAALAALTGDDVAT